MNKLYENNKDDKRTSVLRNINSNILLKNVKKLMFGFKKKLGLVNNGSSNDFVQANYESLCSNLIRLEIISDEFK